jgi:hypothetical protein
MTIATTIPTVDTPVLVKADGTATSSGKVPLPIFPCFNAVAANA